MIVSDRWPEVLSTPSTRILEYTQDKSRYDVVIAGEPEEAILNIFDNLIKHFDRKEEIISNLNKSGMELETNIVKDLNSLGILRFSREELCLYPFIYPIRFHKKVIPGYTMVSRGCPYSCVFCSPMVRKSYGDTVRFRNINIVIEEIKDMIAQGVNFISFEDDNFLFSVPYAHELCQSIIENKLNIKWSTQIRADSGLDDNLLDVMKKSGCTLLQLGVESGSNRVIDLLRKNSNCNHWKEECRRSFGKIHAYDIATCALFIIGSPGETKEEVIKSMNFAKELKPDFIKLHFFTFYPGSVAFEMFKDKISKSYFSGLHHYLLSDFNPSFIDTEELYMIRKYFYSRFLLNPSFMLNHIKNYFGYYLRNFSILVRLIKNSINTIFFKK